MKKKEVMSHSFPDIREARVDTALPTDQRIRLFLSEVGDPYHFCVDGTPVELRFDRDAPALQSCLSRLGRRLQECQINAV